MELEQPFQDHYNEMNKKEHKSLPSFTAPTKTKNLAGLSQQLSVDKEETVVAPLEPGDGFVYSSPRTSAMDTPHKDGKCEDKNESTFTSPWKTKNLAGLLQQLSIDEEEAAVALQDPVEGVFCSSPRTSAMDTPNKDTQCRSKNDQYNENKNKKRLLFSKHQEKDYKFNYSDTEMKQRTRRKSRSNKSSHSDKSSAMTVSMTNSTCTSRHRSGREADLEAAGDEASFYSDSDNNGSSSDDADMDMTPGAFLVSSRGRDITRTKACLTTHPDNREPKMISCIADAAKETKKDDKDNNRNISLEGDKNQSHETFKSKNFRREVWAVLGCVLVLIGIGVGIIFALSSDDEIKKSPRGNVIDGEDGTLGKDTQSPMDADASTDLDGNENEESQRLRELRKALTHLSPDPSVLEDPSTPQYAALAWLADKDKGLLVDSYNNIFNTINSIEENHTIGASLRIPRLVRRQEIRYALATLYYATNGDSWLYRFGFLSPNHECDWGRLPGVIVCDEENEVTELNLDGNNLKGSVPPELRTLSRLRRISLSSNAIPTSSSQSSSSSSSGKALPGLDVMETFRNLGELGESLTFLDLSQNHFGGTIPTSLLNRLTNLNELNLRGNGFTAFASLPFSEEEEVVLLSSLTWLDVGENQLIGSIETIVQDNFPKLETLFADTNNFLISPDLQFPTSMKNLRLSRNQIGLTSGASFDGSSSTYNFLTATIGRLSNLETLYLDRMNNNNVNGPAALPTELGMLTNLRELNLQQNQLTGSSFPWSSLMSKSATALQFLNLEKCGLTGELPTDIGLMFTSLKRLELESNFIEGTIPESIGDLAELEFLDLKFNFLHGSIPSSVGRMDSLRVFEIAHNELSGSVPSQMSSMASLARVRLEENGFTGGNIDFLCLRDDEFGSSTVGRAQNIICNCCQKL